MSLNNQIFSLTAANLQITGNNGARLAAIFSPAMLHLQTTSIEVVDANTLQPTQALIKHNFIDGSHKLINPLAPYTHSLNNRYYSESAGLLDTYTNNMQLAQVGGKTTVQGLATIASDTVATVKQSPTVGTAYANGKDSKSVLLNALRAAKAAKIADLEAEFDAIVVSVELLSSIADALKTSGETTVGSFTIDGKDYLQALDAEKWAELIQLTQAQITGVGALLDVDKCDFASGSLFIANYHASNEQRVIDALTRAGYTKIALTQADFAGNTLPFASVTCKLPKQFV